MYRSIYKDDYYFLTIKDMYVQQRLTLKVIAEHFECSQPTIRRDLQRFRVQFRTVSDYELPPHPMRGKKRGRLKPETLEKMRIAARRRVERRLNKKG